MKRMVEQGDVGRVQLFRAIWLTDEFSNPSTPFDWRFDRRMGGTTIADLGAHLFDLAQWIVGDTDEVVTRSATFVPERPSADGGKPFVITVLHYCPLVAITLVCKRCKLSEKFLQTLLRDLRLLETKLLSENRDQGETENGQTSFLLAEIKQALDNVRTSLWCRMQAASGRNSESDVLVERHRLQRAVDMLRSPVVARHNGMHN